MVGFVLVATLGLAAAPPDPEARIVEYLKQNVQAGKPVVVSELYNNVFTSPAERTALNRLFDVFFKIPLFAAQYQKATGRPPSLREIAERFRFEVPGETEVMLRILEADPRVPGFLSRDPATGQIVRVDVARIMADPRFSKVLERTIAGWEGKPAPAFSVTSWQGKTLTSQALLGKPYVLYFWFTNCPPCLKTSPLLQELYAQYAPRGVEVVGANADKVLELPFDDATRLAYAEKLGLRFSLVDLTPQMQQDYGMVSVFPTLFFVDGKGTVVRHLVSSQDRPSLEAAFRLALGDAAREGASRR